LDVFAYEDEKDKENEELDRQFYRTGARFKNSPKKSSKSVEINFDSEDMTKEEADIDREFQRVMSYSKFK